jgi:hypothetical protein
MQAVVVRTAASVRGARGEQRVVQRTDVLMSPGAAADVLQAIQLQGGATLAGDAADLHARGGDAAETALLVNGSPMIGAVRFESLDGSLFSAGSTGDQLDAVFPADSRCAWATRSA